MRAPNVPSLTKSRALFTESIRCLALVSGLGALAIGGQKALCNVLCGCIDHRLWVVDNEE